MSILFDEKKNVTMETLISDCVDDLICVSDNRSTMGREFSSLEIEAEAADYIRNKCEWFAAAIFSEDEKDTMIDKAIEEFNFLEAH